MIINFFIQDPNVGALTKYSNDRKVNRKNDHKITVMRLRGKVAIVTGGAKGIGRAYSIGLAKEGAKVCIADIDFDAAKMVSDRIIEAGGEALPVRVDVSDEKEVEMMAKACYERFGSIDILINNAAYYIQTKRGP